MLTAAENLHHAVGHEPLCLYMYACTEVFFVFLFVFVLFSSPCFSHLQQHFCIPFEDLSNQYILTDTSPQPQRISKYQSTSV